MQISEMVPRARRLARRLIQWGLKFFILGIGITLLILFLGLFGVSFGVGWQLTFQLGIAISMSFGFTPLLVGCALLICASFYEAILEIRVTRKKAR